MPRKKTVGSPQPNTAAVATHATTTGVTIPTAAGDSSSSQSTIAKSASTARRRGVDSSVAEGRASGYQSAPAGGDKGVHEMSSLSSSSSSSSSSWTARNQWVVYAVASGGCAAFNGVFAKLTTNDLTSHISQGISRLVGLEGAERVLEIVVRCAFFGLNLAFNGVMWTLFTQALAKGHSTTQVSIMNTSTNFVITALLGLAIFSESLPPLWWVGAGLLVAGNVIIGRKEEKGVGDDAPGEEVEGQGGDEIRTGARGNRIEPGEDDDEGKDGEDEDVPLLGDLESHRD